MDITAIATEPQTSFHFAQLNWQLFGQRTSFKRQILSETKLSGIIMVFYSQSLLQHTYLLSVVLWSPLRKSNTIIQQHSLRFLFACLLNTPPDICPGESVLLTLICACWATFSKYTCILHVSQVRCMCSLHSSIPLTIGYPPMTCGYSGGFFSKTVSHPYGVTSRLSVTRRHTSL